MNEIDTSPTRMELQNVDAKLMLAQRGHNMLKKKRDTLVSEHAKARAEALRSRGEFESAFSDCFRIAKLVEMEMGSMSYRNTAYNKSGRIEISTDYKKIAGVKVPTAEAHLSDDDSIPYSLIGTPHALDTVVSKFRELSVMAVRLASHEKKVHILRDEIKKTRRKVNALEKVKIKNLEMTDRYIRGYLDEMEREDYTRLKHIKKVIKNEVG